MECTLLVRRFEKGPVIGTFVFDVQDPVHRVKQMLLEQYGVPGLTVQEVVLEAELSCRFSLTDPCTLPLGDDRPIADLWWERWITHPFPKFQTPYLRLRRLHRENTAGEQEFLVYWRATVAFPGASRYINSIQYVTGSMSVRSLKHRICTVYNLTHFLDSGDYSDIVLYDFRDCRVFDETRTVEENGITPGSVLGLDKRCTIGWEGPAEAFPVTVMKEGPAEDVTVYVRPAERLTGVEERLWLLGHLTSNTKCPSDTKKGQELGFFSLTADERRNMSWTVIQLNIHPSTRLQLQWKPQQIRGPLIASIILKSDILSPSVLDTKSGKSDYDVDQMCEECNVQEAIPGINVIEPLILSECGTEFRITIPGEGWYQCHRTGLRWESTSAASIEYKYLSWKLAVSDLPSRGWIPASPLFDIRVLNGNIASFQIPHFLCFTGHQGKEHVCFFYLKDENYSLRRPTEIQSGYASLKEPSFSGFGLVYWSLAPFFVKIHGGVRIYQVLDAAPVTLHVYLTVNDKSIIQMLDNEESKSLRIKKPSRTKPLKFGQSYYLTSSAAVEILPKELEFKYFSMNEEQVCAEVYTKDKDSEFILHLENLDGSSSRTNEVWACKLRPGDFGIADFSKEMDRSLKSWWKSIFGRRERMAEVSDTVEQHFMDKYRTEIIERLSDIDYILDHMLAKLYISDEQYYRIRSVVVYQEKNRELYKVAQSWDDKAKQEFYDILKKEHPYFVASLEGH